MLRNHLVCVYFVCHGDTKYMLNVHKILIGVLDFDISFWFGVAFLLLQVFPSLLFLDSYAFSYSYNHKKCLCSTVLVCGEGIFKANEVQ